jgi:hypothetical protein
MEGRAHSLARFLSLALICSLSRSLALTHSLSLARSRSLIRSHSLALTSSLSFALALAHTHQRARTYRRPARSPGTVGGARRCVQATAGGRGVCGEARSGRGRPGGVGWKEAMWGEVGWGGEEGGHGRLWLQQPDAAGSRDWAGCYQGMIAGDDSRRHRVQAPGASTGCQGL